MLEVTGNDIEQLGDKDLRDLIGYLCEADLSSFGLQAAGVSWGGSQDSSDGGIDVRVDIEASLCEDNFVPRSKTGFQVKCTDMPRSAIINEIKPNGVLRDVIKELHDKSGAYIIISSKGSLADRALRYRNHAIKEATGFADDKLFTNFYDRDKVASWVRIHPSLVLWVREKIGNPIYGWKSYDNWAKSPGGILDEYIIDNQTRINNNTNPHVSSGLSIVEGINCIRKILYNPKSSVRLVGLSGVGKTRFVQALFDNRVGEHTLDKYSVIYTDISYNPIPAPDNFIIKLLAMREKSVVIVDNCPPSLHRSLTTLCLSDSSLVSLLTIEYDVRDDVPEETEVFRLEPASIDAVMKIIKQRHKYINDLDAKRIADFAGGNARIALSISKTIIHGESIAELRDNELFLRLFKQRNETDNSLLRIAEVCSLVYSFSGEISENEKCELHELGSLIGYTPFYIYEKVSELIRREIVQTRNHWRAVLPLAIANNLAQRALEKIHSLQLDKVFNIENKRLLISFSKRLGYLHNSPFAIDIFNTWTSQGNILDKFYLLEDSGIKILKNIAPINPYKVLLIVENAIEQSNSIKTILWRYNQEEIALLLRSIAYDEDLFTRAVENIIRIALDKENNKERIRDILKSLFHLYMSGSLAKPETKKAVINKLFDSDNKDRIDIGLLLLDATLETAQFSSHYNYEFGSRKRDYGYSPKCREEIIDWYNLFIDYILSLIEQRVEENRCKHILAKSIRGLWVNFSMFDKVIELVDSVLRFGFWDEGLLEVRKTLRFHYIDADNNERRILNSLAKKLEPRNLEDDIILHTLSSNSYFDLYEYDGDEAEKGIRKTERKTKELGKKLACNTELLKILLPKLYTTTNTRLHILGKGLAQGSINIVETWDILTENMLCIDPKKRNYRLVSGFLQEVNRINKQLCDGLLDQAFNSDTLSSVFPIFQLSVDIESTGVKRLKESLRLNRAPICQFSNMLYEHNSNELKECDLIEIIDLISKQPSGNKIAISLLEDICSSRWSSGMSNKMRLTGQKVLLTYEFPEDCYTSHTVDYTVGRMVRFCFDMGKSYSRAKQFCARLIAASKKTFMSLYNYPDTLLALASTQPLAFLDSFIGDRNIQDITTVHERDENKGGPLSVINFDVIVNWCEVNPQTRYENLASIIKPYIYGQNGVIDWSPLSKHIISRLKNPIKALNSFVCNFTPRSYGGSLSDLMKSRLPLLKQLRNSDNPIVSEWAITKESQYLGEIEYMRKLIDEHHMDVGFE